MSSQRLQIQRYLASGRTLTPLQALEKFHCFRLAARVAEIKAAGHPVSTEMVQLGNTRIARYRIAR